MILLIDTNILVRLEDSLDPRHAEAMSAVERLQIEGHECQIVPQVLYEFWVVGTRPVENNGLGLDPAKCEAAIRGWMSFFRLRLDERGVFRRWATSLTTWEVFGQFADRIGEVDSLLVDEKFLEGEGNGEDLKRKMRESSE